MTLKEKFFEIALKNIESLTKEEAKYFLENDALPAVGSVSGLIYNYEINEIFCKYYEELIEVLDEIYAGCFPINVLNKSRLVWTAWELTILNNEENIKEILELAEKRGILEEE